MSTADAPRVPAGMTQEAADLVWFDWSARRYGAEAPFRIDDPRTHADAWANHSKIEPRYRGQDGLSAFLGVARRIPGIEVDEDFVGWRSLDDALRAWAAVGAPVLAPAKQSFNVYVGADLWSDEVPETEVESYVRSAGTGEAEKRFGHFIDPASDEVQAKTLGGGLWEVTVEPMERGRVEVVVVRVEACAGGGS